MDNRKVKISTLPVSSWKKYKEMRLRALKKEYLAFCKAYEKEAVWPDEKWHHSLQDALDGNSWLYFASIRGKLVGMIGGFGDELDRKNHRVYLWGMYVEKLFRRKGIARALANKLLFEIGKRDDICVVWLEVNPELIHALHFYESLGFRKVGVENHIFGDGLLHEALGMEKAMH